VRIVIEVVDHEKQRYDTCGDWQFFDDTLEIRVSNLKDWRMEALVGLHEAVEALLCRKRGITEHEVGVFDKRFETEIPHTEDEEPGDHILSPYRREHFFATNVERLLAAELGVDWQDYEERINAL